MNTDQNTNTDQSVRETRSAKFEKLGIPIPKNNIPNARLDFFERAGIPIPKEKSFYTEQNYGVRNPKILENIKNIKAGDQKKFFDEFLKFSNSKNFGDGIYQKAKHVLVPNPTKYDDNGNIPKTPYPTLDDFTATPIPSTNDIERLFDDTDSPYDNLKMPSRSELYSHLDQISHKPGMISRPIAINKDDFETRPILTEAKRAELFKYYGTYYEKKYDALLKKEQDKLQKEEQEVIINTPLSKVDHFKTVCIEKYNSIKLWINNAKQTVVNYINSIPKKWADWKLRMILSKEQRDLLAALPQALAPKHNEEETENVPDQFKKITQKRNTFDYFKMRDLNERVQQIPE